MKRTSIVDFGKALKAMDACLEKNEPAKKGAWQRQPVMYHIGHSRGHMSEFQDFRREDDLIAAALRAVMALQVHLEKEQ